MLINSHTITKAITTSINKATLRLMLVALICFNCHISWADKNDISKVKLLDKVQVLLVNPSIKNDPFWHKIEQLTKQAAKELNIELAVIHGHGTRYVQLEELKKYFEQNLPPKYIVLLNYLGHAKLTMDFLQKYKVKVITLEQTITKEEKATIGKPGGSYKDWLGEIYFNNTNAGYILAEGLINTAKNLKMKPVVAGISGHYGSESSLRNRGLQIAIKENNAHLTQIVHAGWSAEDAYQKTHKLLKRYPNINIIWCASDHMALGALKAIEESGKIAGIDVLIGGFDWTAEAIKSIQENKLSASIGGHFIMGSIAIMAIYYEEHGLEHNFFANEQQNSFELALINRDNVSQYGVLLRNDELSQVSFQKLIKTYKNQNNLTSIPFLEALKESSKTNSLDK